MALAGLLTLDVPNAGAPLRSIDVGPDRFGVPHLFTACRQRGAHPRAYATAIAGREAFQMDGCRRAAQRLAELPALGANSA